ncbi:Gpi1-domain-containing protein [Ganoderma leucocontextum]|nr:Gpi1-domain-containing protein [Ganoderma leucocontextum]
MVHLVLWPVDLAAPEGIYYGWKRPLICVAGVLATEDRAEAQHVLALAVSRSEWSGVRHMFSSDPVILGYCRPSSGGHSPELSLDAHVSNGMQLVMYRRHKRQSMRFYAFNFNELDILPSQESTEFSLPGTAMTPNEFLRADFTRLGSPSTRKGTALDGEVLSQVNLAHLLANVIEREKTRSVTLPRPPPHTPPPPHAPDSHEPGNTSHPGPGTARTLTTAFSKLYSSSRTFSTTAEQFDVRYEQGVYVYGEVPYVYRDKARTVQSISKYIKFHNCVWLALNDVIIGVTFGSFLNENKDYLAFLSPIDSQAYLVDGMRNALLWLNNWPAGLKLNTELSQFYCHSLIGVVSAWGWLLQHAAPYFPSIIWLVGAGGCCGMTMIISLLSDILSLFTAHLYVCYYISATVFRHQLGLAGSLWNLFRGKRYNVLRNRIDSWDYDMDQLLLGTILFTLLAFLYPTVLTYYALFATARLFVIILHALFDTTTALLNHFPLFALLLRVKDPLRLPGLPPRLLLGD